jgi:hypothetical protein
MKTFTKEIVVVVEEEDLSDAVRDQISDETEGLLDDFCEENNCTRDDVWESIEIIAHYNIHTRIKIKVKE